MYILNLKGWCIMKKRLHDMDIRKNKIKNLYDDGNIPGEDLPQTDTQDIIPDEVERKDGPGGESGE